MAAQSAPSAMTPVWGQFPAAGVQQNTLQDGRVRKAPGITHCAADMAYGSCPSDLTATCCRHEVARCQPRRTSCAVCFAPMIPATCAHQRAVSSLTHRQAAIMDHHIVPSHSLPDARLMPGRCNRSELGRSAGPLDAPDLRDRQDVTLLDGVGGDQLERRPPE